MWDDPNPLSNKPEAVNPSPFSRGPVDNSHARWLKGDTMKDKTECTLAKGFSLWEKVYAQSSFLGMGIIGTVGISLVDWRWIPPYLLIYAYGVMGVVMRHLVCPRCPHLFVYSDCLQCHPRITMWLAKEQKTTPFSPFEKLVTLQPSEIGLG